LSVTESMFNLFHWPDKVNLPWRGLNYERKGLKLTVVIIVNGRMIYKNKCMPGTN